MRDTDYLESDIRARRAAIGSITDELGARFQRAKRTASPRTAPVPWGRWLVIAGVAASGVVTALVGLLLLRRSS